MSKEEEKKNVYNQMAWILNYQPTIKEQHIHMGEKSSVEETSAESVNSKDYTGSVPEDNSTGDDNSKLNFFAPKKVLKEILLEEWFDSICVNKELYHKEWRENLVDDLMASEHRVYIAKQWQHADKWLTIKGQFVGALVWAGILRGSNLAIARTILGISHNTRNDEEKKEANTFAKYMGQGNKEPYADWIKAYVTSQKG